MVNKEIDLIKERFIDELSPLKIYLFGSFANGTENEDSDYDFYIVVKDGTQNIADMTAEAYKSIRSVRSRAVDIVIGTEMLFECIGNSLQYLVSDIVTVCIVDLLELVSIDDHHRSCRHLNTVLDDLITCSVICTGQFVMRSLEIKMTDTVLVGVIHNVISTGKITEF